MVEIKGISASPGIAIGKAYLFLEPEHRVPDYAVVEHALEQEYNRYSNAVMSSIRDLETQVQRLREKDGGHYQFLETHIVMLQDEDFHARVKKKLYGKKRNVENALVEVVNEYLAKIEALEDNYLRERFLDLKDISRRILKFLLRKEDPLGLQQIQEPSVLVCHNLMPSDAVYLANNKVLGIAMDVGGRTTHTAILAQSYEIPAVLGLGNVTSKVKEGDIVVVDGLEGIVLIDPDQSVLDQYRRRKEDYDESRRQLRTHARVKCFTTDNVHIRFKANIENPSEVDSALANGAEGVGLYRSEFLYIRYGLEVDEDTQFEAYRTVLEGFEGMDVTIRTLDLGGDKLTNTWSGPREANPILGWRAIRFCLKNPDIFKTQLRALLRASHYGNLKIMFPLISDVNELRRAMELVEEVKQELRDRGVPFKDNIPIGTMIEVPSAVMIAEHLAKMVQFFSIGTNDLIQYTLAVDRSNEKISEMYDPLHPGILRMIQRTVQVSKAARIDCSICGEMAGDPSLALVLLGLGIEELSMSPVSITQVKSIMREYSYAEARTAVEHLLTLPTSADIAHYLYEHGFRPGLSSR